MTIWGAQVLEPGLAVAWADTEVHRVDENRAIGHRCKLAINPAGFVFVMSGWAEVASRAGNVVRQAQSFDEAFDRLPGVLRRASAQVADRSSDPGRFMAQHAALMGSARPGGAMVAYRFSPETLFVPHVDFAQLSPLLPEAMLPLGPSEVKALARLQLEELRRDAPYSCGGALHLAIIRCDGVHCQVLKDDLSDGDEAAPVTAIQEIEHVC